MVGRIGRGVQGGAMWGRKGKGRVGGCGCMEGVKYNIVARGRMWKGNLITRANMVNFKSACSQH